MRTGNAGQDERSENVSDLIQALVDALDDLNEAAGRSDEIGIRVAAMAITHAKMLAEQLAKEQPSE